MRQGKYGSPYFNAETFFEDLKIIQIPSCQRVTEFAKN